MRYVGWLAFCLLLATLAALSPRAVRAEVLKGEIAEFPAQKVAPAEQPARPANDLAKLASKSVRRA